MEKPRISLLAIFSLVAGMSFFIPIVAGLAAILLGIFAVKSINKSQGVLLGKGVAYTGIGLGTIHGTVWLLVFYAGLTYIVDPDQSGVVIRDGEVQRVVESGLHHKIPFIESVEYYPIETFQALEAKTPFLFSSKKRHSLSYTVQWRICDASKAYVEYGPFREYSFEARILNRAKFILREATAYKSDLKALVTDYTTLNNIENDLNDELNSSGVCVVMFTLRDSE